MAGAATLTEEHFNVGGKTIRRLSWAWTSHTDGAVTAAENNRTANAVTGRIIGIKAEPGTVDETYTFTVVEGTNVMDVLQGCCADTVMSNTDTANTQFRVPITANEGAPILLVDEVLSIVIASAGSGKTGVIHLYIELP